MSNERYEDSHLYRIRHSAAHVMAVEAWLADLGLGEGDLECGPQVPGDEMAANGTALRIADPARFADECLPRYFKHNKLGSFQQQLLTYGFTRLPNESCLDVAAVWQHAQFQRGRPELLEKIGVTARSSRLNSA